jgi:hypothetical protein
MKTRICLIIIASMCFLYWSTTQSNAVCYAWGTKACLTAGAAVTIYNIPPCSGAAVGTVLADASFWSHQAGTYCVKDTGHIASTPCYFVAEYISPCTSTLECCQGVIPNSNYELMAADACRPNAPPGACTLLSTYIPICQNYGNFTNSPACPEGGPQ